MLLLIEMVLIIKLALAITALQQRKEKNDAISPLKLRLQSITSYELVADAMDKNMEILMGAKMRNRLKQMMSSKFIESRFLLFLLSLDGNLDLSQEETLLTIMNTQRMIESGVCPVYVTVGQKPSAIGSRLKGVFGSMFKSMNLRFL